MPDELKPCPFCGASDGLAMLGGSHSYIMCGCGACGPDKSTDKAAIAAWNTRAPELTDYTDEEIAAAQRTISEKYGIGKGKLTPLEEPRAPVRVKPLIWESEEDKASTLVFHRGTALGLRYSIYADGETGSIFLITCDGWSEQNSITAAKAAAQADIKRRVMEWLE